MKFYSDSVIAKFWRLVEVEPGGCWTWTGTRNWAGYGRYYFSGKTMQAHRFSWVLAHGEPIPDGLFVCHHCDNPPCVRPDHLFLGTHLDNMADKKAKGHVLVGQLNPRYRMSHQRNPNPAPLPPPRTRRGFRRGEAHPNAKLTESQVEEIRTLYFHDGFTQVLIAEKFGISQTQVGNIIRGVQRTVKG